MPELRPTPHRAPPRPSLLHNRRRDQPPRLIGRLSQPRLVGIGFCLAVSLAFVVPVYWLLRGARRLGGRKHVPNWGILSLLLAGLLVASPAFAIQFDTTLGKISTDIAAGTTQTIAYTTNGTNRVLLVVIKSTATPDSVTYNGVAMTNLATDAGHPGFYETYKDRLYYLANPAIGANNLVITWPSSHAFQSLSIASYEGVDQTTPLDAYEAWTFSNTGVTTDDVTVATADAWAVMFSQSYDDAGFTAGTSTTERLDSQESGFGSHGVFDSNGPLSTGTKTLTATFGGDDHSDQRIIALRPYTESTSTEETPTTTTDLSAIEEYLEIILFGVAVLILILAGGTGYQSSKNT